MDTPTPINLTALEQARIQADAYAGAFEDHRKSMDPSWPGDLVREKQLHRAAALAARMVQQLEAFDAHADAAIDLTGGTR